MHIVMELADSNLKQFIKLNNKLWESFVVEIMKQIASALSFLAINSIIHRDVNPNSILVFYNSGQLVFKVVDFGFAREIGKKSDDSIWHPRLYSTGNLKHKIFDVSVDIYSLGVVLAECLVGKQVASLKDVENKTG